MGSFVQQGVGYSHIHVETVYVPQEGANAGQRYTFRQYKSAEYGNGNKVASIDGPQMGPVQLAPGGAEPTWKLEISRDEWQKFVKFVGPGYAVIPGDITHTWQLPGQPAHTDYIDGCMIEDDGLKTAKGDPAMVSLGGKCAVVWFDGIHPWDPTIPPRT